MVGIDMISLLSRPLNHVTNVVRSPMLYTFFIGECCSGESVAVIAQTLQSFLCSPMSSLS